MSLCKMAKTAGLGGQELNDLHLDIIEGTCPQGLDRTAAESHFTLLGLAWPSCPVQFHSMESVRLLAVIHLQATTTSSGTH